MTIMHSEAETGDVRADVIHGDAAVIQNLEQHGSSLECNIPDTPHYNCISLTTVLCYRSRTLRIFFIENLVHG